MPVALLQRFVLLTLYVESVLSDCKVSVRTLDFGCHLEWECPDSSPNSTYTVQGKAHGASWENVSDCTRISRQRCDLSHIFPNLNANNYIRMQSEELRDWTNETLCDPINDEAATFSPPSIIISMENRSLWVTVNFPCAPAISCSPDKEEMEMHCRCPLSDITTLSATVKLYNKHKPSDIQIRSAEVSEEKPFREEFGFFIPGQVYCTVANFTSEGPLVTASSPLSLPQCIYIPAKSEKSLIIVVVCAVAITLGLVFILLWRQCASPEPPLPKSLALLHDQGLQNTTFINSSNTASDRKSSESDQVSIVSLSDFTLVENHSYHLSPSLKTISQNLGSGYYRSPILQDLGCIEESPASLAVGSGDLETDGSHCFELLCPSHLILEGGERFPYLEENLNIPLSSVRINHTGQEETTTDIPKQYGDGTVGIREQECML